MYEPEKPSAKDFVRADPNPGKLKIANMPKIDKTYLYIPKDSLGKKFAKAIDTAKIATEENSCPAVSQEPPFAK